MNIVLLLAQLCSFGYVYACRIMKGTVEVIGNEFDIFLWLFKHVKKRDHTLTNLYTLLSLSYTCTLLFNSSSALSF